MARKFANHKYEVDELINEVWLIGRVPKLSNIRFAYRRTYFDIIEYIRTQEGRKKLWYSQVPDSKYRTHFKSMNADLEFHKNDTGDHNTYEIFMGVDDSSFAQVDFKEELNLLMEGFIREQKLIVKLKLEGFNQTEIGLVIGVSESRISQIMIDIGIQLLEKIKSKGINYNERDNKWQRKRRA